MYVQHLAVSMDYDKTDIPENYDRGRDHGPAVTRLWVDSVASHVKNEAVQNVLDLGCGTGRFSQALAKRFNSCVIGIDPSWKMLRQGSASLTDSRVHYTRGSAEALPLRSGSVDVVFISMVFHHFDDPSQVARECRRVLRKDGKVFLRTGTLEKIPTYPYVRFFPASRQLLERRLPSIDAQRRVFEEASFRTAFSGIVTQQVAENFGVYADKLSVGADSILASLDRRDFEAGMEALRLYAAEVGSDEPVTEPIDVLVFDAAAERGADELAES